MQHPLVNPSLAPFGFVFPSPAVRLRFKPEPGFGVNQERTMCKLWEKLHRSNAPGPLPIETIIHDILPGMAASNRFTAGDFEFRGRQYLSRDIAVLSTVVQWFSTGVGRCYLEDRLFGHEVSHPEREFVEKLDHEMKRRDIVAVWLHTCTDRCRTCGVVYFPGDPHHYQPASVTARDRALVRGLMWWLGKKPGRAFIEEQKARIRRAHEGARARDRQRLATPVAA